MNNEDQKEDQLKIESELHKKMFALLDEHPHIMEQKKLRDYLDFFFNPGEIIYQEMVVLVDEKDLDSDFVEEGRTEVVIEEDGFLMHTKVPHEREDTGGMWVEVHSVESSMAFDNHDKFKRMLGRPIRVTVEILDEES